MTGDINIRHRAGAAYGSYAEKKQLVLFILPYYREVLNIDPDV